MISNLESVRKMTNFISLSNVMISGLSVSVFNLKLLNSRSRASLAKFNYLYLHKRGILFLFFQQDKKGICGCSSKG